MAAVDAVHFRVDVAQVRGSSENFQRSCQRGSSRRSAKLTASSSAMVDSQKCCRQVDKVVIVEDAANMRLGRRVHRGRLASRRHGRSRRKTHRYEAALRKLEESRSTAPAALTCTHAAVKIRAAWRRQNRVRGCQTSIEATPPPSGEVGISITSVERAGEEEISDGGSARAGIGLAADERAVAAAGLIWSRWKRVVTLRTERVDALRTERGGAGRLLDRAAGRPPGDCLSAGTCAGGGVSFADVD